MQASGTKAVTSTTSSVTSSATNSSNGAQNKAKGSKISTEDIQVVQNLIERCLQLYMNQTEVITALHRHSKIEPGFTSLVWQKLEQQNPEFFKAYNVRLRIKEQITAFNYLVSQQVQLMQKNTSSVPYNVAPTVIANPASMGVATAGTTTRPSYFLQPIASTPLTFTTPNISPAEYNQLMTSIQTFDPTRNITSGATTSTTTPLKASNSNTSLSSSTAGMISLELSTDQTELDTNQFFLSESDG
eukprot:TRINITY_DN14709_c0_g1_i1.p1 TRINITY_DN14709_c0_g1~~TRINITY_DN14709_c0_g1_i1.p1  ORF type:complete len:244 (-),score=34.85 TRINITY_DN14709_c0_g1_i1:71-802(-)